MIKKDFGFLIMLSICLVLHGLDAKHVFNFWAEEYWITEAKIYS